MDAKGALRSGGDLRRVVNSEDVFITCELISQLVIAEGGAELGAESVKVTLQPSSRWTMSGLL